MIEHEDGDKCPVCDKGKLVETIKDLPWQFGMFPNRRRTVFNDAKIFICDVCSEGFFDKETNDRVFNWVEECLNETN